MKRTLSLALVAVCLMGMVITADAAPATVKIGLSAPITGNYAEYGQNFNIAVRMAADEINAKGGIRGRKVEIVTMDSKGDPKESALIAQKFVEDRSIVASIGDFTSSCCLAAAPIYERGGLVQLSPTSSSPLFAPSGDYMFGVVGTQDAEGPFNAKNIARDYLKAKTVSTIYINNDWGVITNDRFVKAAKDCKVNVLTAQPFMEGEKDFTAVLTKIRRTNPDALFIAAMYNEAAAIARQIRKMGWDVQLFAPSSVFSSQLLELGGDAVEGIVTNAFFVLSDPDPTVQRFIKDFEARAKRFPNLHAACAYDSMMILGKAIEKAGFERKPIRDALAQTKGYMGVTGEITFTPAGDVVRKYKIITVENGEWVVKKGF